MLAEQGVSRNISAFLLDNLTACRWTSFQSLKIYQFVLRYKFYVWHMCTTIDALKTVVCVKLVITLGEIRVCDEHLLLLVQRVMVIV